LCLSVRAVLNGIKGHVLTKRAFGEGIAL
jgi:hypothetical protein